MIKIRGTPMPEADLGLLPGAGGTQRLPRTIGTPAALMHVLMGQPLNPREAEKKGLVHETVAARLSTAQWRLRGACRRIRGIRSPTLNVSSATLLRRRWRKALRLNEISSRNYASASLHPRACVPMKGRRSPRRPAVSRSKKGETYG